MTCVRKKNFGGIIGNTSFNCALTDLMSNLDYQKLSVFCFVYSKSSNKPHSLVEAVVVLPQQE